jgi:pyruvate kinase
MVESDSVKTKIVCTIGPASGSREVLERMIAAGMDVARINFAHGDFQSHAEVIAAVRDSARKVGRRVAILGDLAGPKLRIGSLAKQPVELEQGQAFTLAVGDFEGDAHRVSTTFEGLPEAVRTGDTIFLNDGMIQLEVCEVAAGEVRCAVAVGGPLLSHKGINVPDADLGISAFTGRDRECLAFAAAHGLEAVGQSFVQRGEDIETVRKAARGLGYRPMIFAKIERSRALSQIDRILEAADGIMVARGDLGVEIPIERIALAQKELIGKANLSCKPVITATQMLLSMVDNRRPTRAEVTDVANAILDGTDCVMLSEESAIGAHPVEAVDMLTKIACATEPQVAPRSGAQWLGRAGSNIELVASSVAAIAQKSPPLGILVPTKRGATPRQIAAFRLPVPVTAVSRFEKTCQELLFSYGVHALHEPERSESWQDLARRHFGPRARPGAKVLLTEGAPGVEIDGTNRLEIIDL